MSACKRAWAAYHRSAVEVGSIPDGWIIGSDAWREIRRDAESASAVTFDPDGPERLYGLPVTVYGRDGVYPTHDARLFALAQWFVWPGDQPRSTIHEVRAPWADRAIACSHAVGWGQSAAPILERMILKVRALAFGADTGEGA